MAKKKKKEAFTYAVPSYYASYFVNGDASSLDDDELERCQEFEKEVANEHGNANFIPTNDMETFFGFPDMGGLMANCVELVIIES